MALSKHLLRQTRVSVPRRGMTFDYHRFRRLQQTRSLPASPEPSDVEDEVSGADDGEAEERQDGIQESDR